MSHMTDAGPVRNVAWASSPKRVRAKQLEMLAIDQEYHEQWVAFMVALVSENLSDREFTLKRMDALKIFSKERKRRQHNLHYKYDVKRRRAGLIDRDIERLRQRIESAQRGLEEAETRTLPPRAERPEPQTPPRKTPTTTPTLPARLPLRPTRDLSVVDPSLLHLIAAELHAVDPLLDLEHATDDELASVMAASSIPPYAEAHYLGVLNGQSESRPASRAFAGQC